MENTNQKISFIPKGSLVREESFLDRPRPKSVIGIFAIFVFVASVSSYVGLRFYNDTLANDIVSKTDEIKRAQKEFSDAPQVGRAKVFQSRAALARELLDTHTLVSPALSFLSQGTVSSILYNGLSFTNGEEGAVLVLSGEAPNYASLAFQGDVLREKNKELSNVSIYDVGLTKIGTVTFAIAMTFAPDYLSYTKNLNTSATSFQGFDGLMTGIPPTVATSSGSSSLPPWSLPVSVATTSVSSGTALPHGGMVTVSSPSPEQTSAPRSLWSRFKFW